MGLLQDIIIIFTIAVAVVFICNRLGIPSIVGFLITGVFAGPGLLGIVGGPEEVHLLSEIGIILLLFTIGLEFSIKNLLEIGRTVLLGGTLQVLITIAVIAGILFYWKDANQAVFYGFVIALSSTAIVMKIYQEKLELDTTHGRAVLAILIFQDIIVVPMMLVTPILAGVESVSDESGLVFALKSAGLILFIFMAYRWIVPWIFYQLAKSRSRELLILSAVVTCFAIAGLTYSMGLSLELGAFIAGLIISETEYSYETIGNIIPFRDVFASMFFISIGMMLDLNFMAQEWQLILGGGLAIILIKFIIAGTVVLFLGFPLVTALIVGFSLCQIGEFSFILSKVGFDNNIFTAIEYQTILAMAIITMVISSFIINFSRPVAEIIMKTGFMKWLDDKTYNMRRLPVEPSEKVLADHLVIIGFGINGRNVAKSARIAGIPYTIIETNPETVKKETAKGENIIYGDASNEEVLKHANIIEARVLVTTIPDAPSTRRVIFTARKLNPDIHIIARTRFVKEVNDLFLLGASEVIPEEFETSVEIFTRLLKKFNIPLNEINNYVELIRADGYRMFRTASIESITPNEQRRLVRGMEMVSYKVEHGAPAEGKMIIDLEIRKKYGVTILVINRGIENMQNPEPYTVIQPDDIVMLVGMPEQVSRVCELFRTSSCSWD
jgi:CPA2 family monovalent cation:H+ antiporter-2